MNGEGLISLTDLWKAAGGEERNKPVHWLKAEPNQKFIKHLAEVSQSNPAYFVQTRRGGTNPGTFAHWQIALAYAKYLSPELHMAVNEVFMRYKAGDPKLAEEVIDREITLSLPCQRSLQPVGRPRPHGGNGR